MLLLPAQERVTLWWCAATAPLPITDSMTGDFAALLTKSSVAVAVPEDCGENVTVKGIECPARMFTGVEIPPTVNSIFVVVTEETVTAEPVALSVPLRDPFEPTGTLPKFNVLGDSVNCPCAVSLPESAMLRRGFEAVERIKRSPEVTPEVPGANTTRKVKLCPDARLTGSDMPATLNAGLDMLACDTVTLVLPVFVRVSFSVSDSPGGMFPNLSIAGEAAIVPSATFGMPVPNRATVEEAFLL